MKKTSHPIDSAPTPSILFGDLMLTRLKIHVSFEETATLPAHSGSAWRGLIGWQIRSLVCPFDRRPNCTDCIIQNSCPYFILMEKKSPLPGMAEAPKGYVISPDPVDRDGHQIIFITLIGRCTRLLPVLLQALLTGQHRGIGVARHPYRVEAMAELGPDGSASPLYFSDEGIVETRGPWSMKQWLPESSAKNGPLELCLITPVRLRRKGRYAGEMDWAFCLESLARRLEGLNQVFNEAPPMGKTAWLSLNERFKLEGPIQTSVRWKDMSRYSNRQRRKVPMGGLVGRAVLTSPTPWSTSWWKAAELVHVGKGAAMGWGKIVVM